MDDRNTRGEPPPPRLGWEDLWFFAPPTYNLDALPDPMAVHLAERLQPAAHVLDIGCGMGRNALHLLKQGHAVTALDLSPTALNVLAREVRPSYSCLNLVLGCFTSLPFRPASFDAALAVNVIYHSTRKHIESVLRRVHELLAPGGWFAFNLLSRHHWQHALYLEETASGRAREIETGSYMAYPEYALNDMALPHHFLDGDELDELLAPYAIVSAEEIRGESAMGATGRWVVLLVKR